MCKFIEAENRMCSNYSHSSSQSELDDIMKFYKMGKYFFLNFCNQELESTSVKKSGVKAKQILINVCKFFLERQMNVCSF